MEERICDLKVADSRGMWTSEVAHGTSRINRLRHSGLAYSRNPLTRVNRLALGPHALNSKERIPAGSQYQMVPGRDAVSSERGDSRTGRTRRTAQRHYQLGSVQNVT